MPPRQVIMAIDSELEGGGTISTATDSTNPIETLERSVNGEIVRPGGDAYDTYRRVWNGMIDKHPALIARCASVADVVASVNFAREQGLLLAVRGGGHSFAGFSTCDDGLVLDLSPMNVVEVHSARRTARAGAGATWGIFDAATHVHGLATTGGLISSTGIAGLTLVGGIGWLQRKCGLACDNLLSVQMVTASGEVVRASAEENSDLFWALRGGGGNFGVVTEFEFRLHPVSSVLGGLMLFPLDRYVDVMRFYRDFVHDCPDELTTWLSAITAPAADFIPVDLHGKPALAVLACHCGDPQDAERTVKPLRDLGPGVDLIEAMPYPELQKMFDEDLPYGIRCYQKAGYAAELTDRLIDVIVEHTSAMPSPTSTFDFHHMGGAVARVPDDATAFGDRRTAYCFNIVGVWDDPAADDTNRNWARTFASSIDPFATGGVYVNFTTDADGVRAAYSEAKYARLQALKRKYDPANFFRLNQNIAP
jgi:FAD/FMN-containing dehydrogenase